MKDSFLHKISFSFSSLLFSRPRLWPPAQAALGVAHCVDLGLAYRIFADLLRQPLDARRAQRCLTLEDLAGGQCLKVLLRADEQALSFVLMDVHASLLVRSDAGA